jgi:hypothetical protein
MEYRGPVGGMGQQPGEGRETSPSGKSMTF